MELFNQKTIELIISLCCLSITFKRFDPIQSYIKRISTFPGKIYPLIYKVLSCSMCISFWLTLIITRDIYISVITSVLTTYISQQTDKI